MSDDLYRQLEDRLVQLIQEFNAYRNVNPLENASIRKGRVRFVGGLLRVDSGGRVEIVGTLEIDGTTTVTGEFTVTGPWGLEGDGTITGDVTISGALDVTGPWSLTGDGDIDGDVDLTGILSVLGGGRIKVGSAMEITPASSGGAIAFETGGELRSADGLTWLVHGNNGFAVDATQAIVRYGVHQLRAHAAGVEMKSSAGEVIADIVSARIASGSRNVRVTPTEVVITSGAMLRFGGLATITASASGLPVNALHINPVTSVISRVVAG